MADALQYADLDLTLRRRVDGTYQVDVLYRPPGNAIDVELVAGPPPIARFNQATLLALSLEPEAYAQALSAAIFADERLRTACLRALDQVRSGSAPLRVRLCLDPHDSDLQLLHWELLEYPVGTGTRSLTLSQGTLFSRYLRSSSIPFVSRPGRGGLTALAVIANPTNLGEFGLRAIDTVREEQQLAHALTGLSLTILASHLPEARPTMARLQQQLNGGASHCLLLLSRDPRRRRTVPLARTGRRKCRTRGWRATGCYAR